MSALVRRLWRAWRGCGHGHLWFPGEPRAREFIPAQYVCLRCTAAMTLLPTGTCLGDGVPAGAPHPLADHYDARGEPVRLASCVGPR